MLSRLYSKYIKNDIGVLIFYFILFFMFSNFPLFLSLHNKSEITNNAYNYLFISSSVYTCAALFSTIESCRQFYFLYEKRRVDFFYSLPLNRNKLFATKYFTGIFYVLFPFTLNILIGLITCMAAGISGKTVSHILFSILYEMVFFIMCYTICVFLMIITGKVAVYILNVILINYLSLLIYLTSEILFAGLFNQWESLENPTLFEKALTGISELSPLMHYFSKFDNFLWVEYGYNTIWHVNIAGALKYIPVYFLFLVLFLILSLLLFNRLGTENCTKTLTFSKSERPVQVFLTVMFGILFGGTYADVYSYNAYAESFLYSTIITLLTVVMLHSLIELAYTGDIKKIFKHRLQLLICFLVALLGALQPFIQR